MRLHEFNRWYAWYFTKLNWNYSPPTWSIQAQWSSGSWQLEVMERIGTSSCCWRCANEVHTHIRRCFPEPNLIRKFRKLYFGGNSCSCGLGIIRGASNANKISKFSSLQETFTWVVFVLVIALNFFKLILNYLFIKSVKIKTHPTPQTALSITIMHCFRNKLQFRAPVT